MMIASGPEVVLHIGGQKCGSSALQGYLFFGRYGLAKYGIRYLDDELGDDLAKAKSHSNLLPRLRQKGAESWVRDRLALLDWADPSKRYVLSSEGFCEIRNVESYASALAPLGDFARVHIVLYVRSQVELIYSGWQQWGSHLSFSDWVESALKRDFANWNRIFSAWRQALPDANFSVRIFSRDRFPDGDLVADFRQLLGWPAVQLLVKKAANPTFDDLTVLAVQRLAAENKVEPGPIMISMKKAGIALPRSGENLVLDAVLQAEISDHYAVSNACFLKNAGIGYAEAERLIVPKVARCSPFSEEDVVRHQKVVVENLKKVAGHEGCRVLGLCV